MKTNYQITKEIIKNENRIENKEKQIADLEARMAERQRYRSQDLHETASKRIEKYDRIKEGERRMEERSANRFEQTVNAMVERHAQKRYDKAVKNALFKSDEEIEKDRRIKGAKLRDVKPKIKQATENTTVYKKMNEERRSLWNTQKFGAAVMGAVAVGGLATAAVLGQGFEGVAVDNAVASLTTAASLIGSGVGAALGSAARDVDLNNKFHRVAQAIQEAKGAGLVAEIQAGLDVQNGEINPEEYLSEKELAKFDELYGNNVQANDMVNDNQNEIELMASFEDDFSPEA